MTPARAVCIHGHFYQPPRANPHTGRIETEPSAAPHANWNLRITDECYRPNTHAAGPGGVAQNNYAWMSFNVGPTLLDWMERHARDVYDAILAADRESRQRWGFGNAIAQSMHHTILPLCNPRDRETEIRWGIDDFEFRFGRHPEGLWLPEAAVDVATLEAVAAAGIAYVIVSPRQVRAVRDAVGCAWRAVDEGSLDTTRAYRVALPSGGTIALFVYDGAVSQAVAFNGVLNDGAALGRDLAARAADGPPGPCLLNIATDGESYGHHHRFGDIALAYALAAVRGHGEVALTNYAAWLAANPPRAEAQLVEPSSWSCAHGVERWRSDCGCALAPGPPGAQAWRTPLRTALDWLRDQLAGFYQEEAGRLVDDPWEVRDRYHACRLRGDAEVGALIARHARRPLSTDESERVRDLLRMQRFALMMFTSCGWFFDAADDIGTVQDLRAAALAAELYEGLAGVPIRQTLLRRLAGVPGAAAQILGHPLR